MTIPVVAIVVPIFNEESCLPELIRRLVDLRDSNQREFEFRAILVDDGSTDQSRELLKQYALKYEWIESRLLTRNFGHQIAVTAGMDIALTDYVSIIDGDLQDPPELIPEMIRQLISNGDQIVYGQRSVRKGESAFKLWTAHFFYKLIRRSSHLDIPLDTGDFRVMTRRARDVICQLREHNRFLRGLAPWTGLKSSSFNYSRDLRYAGTTKYTFRKMVALAFNAIVSFSAMPLRFLQGLGLTIALLGCAGLVVSSFLAISGTSNFGLGILASLNALISGITIGAVGLVGCYVHRIQDEVRGRPLYMEVEI
jgi:dolichol-phosphate mannosyltransferase